MVKKIRVLTIDDSALVRKIITKGLALDPMIEVVGTAPDVYVARDKIVLLKPDVLTLDIEMPRMDGVEFLKRLMPQYPLPTVIVSALAEKGAKATLEALKYGAVDFILKPSIRLDTSLSQIMDELRVKVRMAAGVNVRHWYRGTQKVLKKPVSSGVLAGTTDKVIAMGASTGGTTALRRIISEYPPDMPGTVVVQHMPPVFTKMFADSLNTIARVEVKEAEPGDKVMTGRVLIAPGDKHLIVKRSGGFYRIDLTNEEKMNGHRPSVGILFNSLAENVGSNAVGVMLTGMGRDGAEAMLKMRKAGARTFAQDKASSVVFGMPSAAHECGASERLVGLEDITSVLIDTLREMR